MDRNIVNKFNLEKKTFFIKTRYKYDNLKNKHMVHKMDTVLEIRI